MRLGGRRDAESQEDGENERFGEQLFGDRRVIMRRDDRAQRRPEPHEAPATQLHFGDWRLDTQARHLVDSGGAVVSLSGAEFRLPRVLLQHPHRVLSREQLLQLTQGREADVFDRSIDLLVSRVRQRLRDGRRDSRYIKTIRNEGYVFCMAVEPGGRA